MKKKENLDKYIKTIEWSEEDKCYIGRCPELFDGGCHGDDSKAVFEELCTIVEETLEIYNVDRIPLPKAISGEEVTDFIKNQSLKVNNFNFVHTKKAEKPNVIVSAKNTKASPKKPSCGKFGREMIMDKVILFYEHDDGYLHFETAFTNDDDAKVFSSMYSHFMQMEIPLNEERYMEKINAIKCFTNAGLSLFQVYLYLGKNKPAVYYSPWNNYISNPEIIKHDANVKYKGEMYLYYVIAKDEKEALNKAIQFRNELLANNNWVSDKKKKKGMSSKTRYALYLTLKKEFEKEK